MNTVELTLPGLRPPCAPTLLAVGGRRVVWCCGKSVAEGDDSDSAVEAAGRAGHRAGQTAGGR